MIQRNPEVNVSTVQPWPASDFHQSSSRNTRCGSRGWWEGKREEDPLSLSLPFLLSITPLAPLRRDKERLMGTSQGPRRKRCLSSLVRSAKQRRYPCSGPTTASTNYRSVSNFRSTWLANYRGSVLWNKIPLEIRKLPSLNVFKTSIHGKDFSNTPWPIVTLIINNVSFCIFNIIVNSSLEYFSLVLNTIPRKTM